MEKSNANCTKCMNEQKCHRRSSKRLSQVRRLADVARKFQAGDKLLLGLSRTRIAAVGPVVVAALEAIGARAPITPHESFRLKRMISEIAKAIKNS